MKKRRLLSFVLSGAMLFGSIALLPENEYANSVSITARAEDTNLFINNNAQYRTKQQIIDYINRHPFIADNRYGSLVSRFNCTLDDSYYVQPQFEGSNFVQGSLSDKSKWYGLNALNCVRYIAGLNEVSLNETYNDYAQAAALCDAAINQLTHYPEMAEGMSYKLYAKGSLGAQESNLGMGYGSVADGVVRGWMLDEDRSNIDRVGHRRWCLNPAMESTGFGHAGAYTAMYAHDQQYSTNGYTVAWPSANTPYMLFRPDSPWSVSKNSAFSNNTKVVLKRIYDSKTWTFSTNKSDGDFYISNEYYGQYGCVIFRPDVEYDELFLDDTDEDIFNVTITDGNYRLSYNVDFFMTSGYTNENTGLIDNCFDKYSNSPKHNYNDGKVKRKPTCTNEGSKEYVCTICGNTQIEQIKALGHNYDKLTWEWIDTNSATAKFVCANDSSHIHKEKAVITSKSTPATCTEAEKIIYTATISFNGKTYTDTKTIPGKKSTGHKWPEWKTTAFDVAKGTSTQTRTCSVCNKTETKTTKNAIQRLAGANRYETAADISQTAFDKADTVVLANGLNYADALAGVSLATKMNAPILLTNTKTLDATTLAEIKRLKAKNVIILGGTGAISDQVKKELENNGLTTERIAGASRFGTATAIAEKLNENPTDVFFVYAFNSADALSVSPIAANKNAPIIYLTTKGDLNADTAAYLAKLKKAGSVKNAYVIGGEGVISNDMATKAAKALGLSKATRIAGKDRFATCVAVNEQFKDTLNGDMLCVATGMDFPDALAGGVYAAINKAPLFLVNGKLKTPKLSDEQKAYLKAKSAAKITIFGGEGAVPDNHITILTATSLI